MGGAIAIRRFHLRYDLTGGRAAQSFVTKSRTRDIPTEALEGVPLMGATRDVGSESANWSN